MSMPHYDEYEPTSGMSEGDDTRESSRKGAMHGNRRFRRTARAKKRSFENMMNMFFLGSFTHGVLSDSFENCSLNLRNPGPVTLDVKDDFLAATKRDGRFGNLINTLMPNFSKPELV